MRQSLTLVLLLGSSLLFCGCASMNTPAARLSNSFYTFRGGQTVGLIRAFCYQGDTVLQFGDLSGETPGIVDGEGRQVAYRRVGSHYLVLSGTFGALSVYEGNASVKISGKVPGKEAFAKSPAPPEGSIPPPLSSKCVLVVPQKVVPAAAKPGSATGHVSVSAGKSDVPPGLSCYVVQAASYTSKAQAVKLQRRLAAMGYGVEIKVRTNPKLGAVYGVRLRPAGEIEALENMKRLRRTLGVKPMLLVISNRKLQACDSSRSGRE
ncbi:MAG: SPOR domain-containing protein [Syntrophobacteraceae bacterium]